MPQLDKKKTSLRFIGWVGAGFLVILACTFIALVVQWVSQPNPGAQAGQFFTWLLSTDRSQVTWYVTRSAGIVAYLLLWLSTMWGLAVPSKILSGALHGSFTFDFHEFISLLAIGFLIVHIGILLFDQYLTFSLSQVLFPFISAYRPVWVGIGVLSFYVVLLVTVTFYLRERIGSKAFRAIHTLSLLSFLGAALHGLFAGTDSALPAMQLIYAGTLISVVFLSAYWLAAQGLKKVRSAKAVSRPAG
ncbi:MAG: ferric reductase-like transmembrane domain-containing protein [Anaerolineaceae bacterium]|nr:ferric reductase-like transmembrane domain-containing protein [Anaerolineaceae bacterium]